MLLVLLLWCHMSAAECCSTVSSTVERSHDEPMATADKRLPRQKLY